MMNSYVPNDIKTFLHYLYLSLLFALAVFADVSTVVNHHVQRVSAKHGVKDDFAFLWEHAIFRHPPNKNPLTDRSEILHS
jgi:hypothetical protein